MKKTVLLLLLFAQFCSAQTISIYGGFLKSKCLTCFQTTSIFRYELEATVFFDEQSIIPDSILISDGLNNTFWGLNIQTLPICNKIIKVKYFLPSILYNSPGIYTCAAKFNNAKVKFKNDTIDFFLFSTLQLGYFDFGFENISTSFKDNPIIEVEKGRFANFNLTKNNQDEDSIIIENIKANISSQSQNINNIKVNSFTGDMYIPNSLDTGWYFFWYEANDYLKKYKILHSTSRNFLSLHIVSKKLPYFNHFTTAKIDEVGINNLYASTTDKKVNYQADYINPKGLGNYSVDVTATKPLNKPPTVTSTQINDTLLHINIDVNLDSGYYQVYRDLPTSFSIIVTTTDSIGNCKQDLTSFYLTNNPKNSLVEVNEKNKIIVFPNPASNKINIEFEGKVPKNLIANIYDSKGSLIKSETLINNEIDINNLAQGLYLLTIESEGKSYSSKFVKE
jgi:hypothetical protein